MNWQSTPYAVVYLVVAALSGTLMAIAWRQRVRFGGMPLALLMLAVTEWAFTGALELIAVTVPAKAFWSKIGYLGTVATPLLFMIFALEYTMQSKWLIRRNIALLAIVPTVTVLLAYTNEWHGLIWNSFTPSPAGNNILIYGHGAWLWISVGYSYLLVLVGTVALVRAGLLFPGLYRRQMSILLIAVAVPWVGSAIYVSGSSPTPGLDLTPIAFAVSGFLFVVCIVRFQLFDLVPIARDTVFETLGDAVLVLDSRNRIIDINQAAQQLIGRDFASAIGQPVIDVLFPWHDLVELFLGSQEIQTEIIVGEKAPRCFDLRISPLYEQQQRLAGRLVVMHEITERKRNEEALRESELRYRTLFDNLPVPVFSKDLEGRYTSCNAESLKYWSANPEGHTDAELLPPEIAISFREADRRVMETKNPLLVEEHIETPFGPRTVLSRKVPLLSHSGDMVGILGASLDITERKDLEQQLRAERDFALQVMNMMGQGLTVTDADSRFVYVNPAYARMVGIPPEELIGKRPVDVTMPEDRSILTRAKEGRTAGKITSYETRFRHPDGSVTTALVTGVPRRREGISEGAIAVITDLTERKRLEEAELEARKLAESLRDTAVALGSTLDVDQVLERILANVSRVVPHDTANIMLIDASTDSARIIRCRGYAERGSEEAVLALRFPIADLPHLRRMLDTGLPIIIPDTRADPDWRVFAESQWIRSYLAAPICIKNQTVGFINLDSAMPDFFTQVHADRLQVFANQAAIALDNARLLAETQKRATEFIALYETTRDLTTLRPDLPSLLQHIVERAVRLLNGAGGGMYVYDVARGDLEFAVTTHPATPVGTRLPLGEGMAGRVAQTRQAMIVDDYHTWLYRSPKFEGTPLTAVIEVPMLYGGDLIGVLGVEEIGETARRFTEADARLLALFAGQAAAAVHNARLFQEAQRELAERKQAEERLIYLSTHDAHTGLYSRAYFEAELARLQRGREFPVSIVMADVDGLKAVNDTQGHAAGDELLRQAARVLQTAFRVEDVVARIGGDEFAVLLPSTDAAAAEQALSRIRECQQIQNATHTGFPAHLSLGAATAEKGEMLVEALKQADARMYQEKRQLRNCELGKIEP